MLWAVSRAPLAKLAGIQAAEGLDVSLGVLLRQRLQFRFQRLVHRGATARGAEYNFRRDDPVMNASGRPATPDAGPAENAATTGTDVGTYTRERPGMSAFALEDGAVYHTYSTYARGVDALWGMYQWLDRAPKGRNETGVWWRRHDEYDKRQRHRWFVALLQSAEFLATTIRR